MGPGRLSGGGDEELQDSSFPLRKLGRKAHGGEKSGADRRAGGSLNCPHFSSCSAWWGRCWEGEQGVTALLLQLAETFILPLQRGESKSKEDKSAHPTKDIEMSGEGREGGGRERQRQRESPAAQTKA